jgi:hypothetical protein
MSFHYVGSELELFAAATNWKAYFGSVLHRFVLGRVLEVGAGIRSTIPYLYNDLVTEWTALAPDADLAVRMNNGWQGVNYRPITAWLTARLYP